MAATCDVVIDQGANWYLNVNYQLSDENPINLTSYTAALQVRSLTEDATAVLTLTTENGGIAITGETGLIAIEATPTQTEAINDGTYYYYLEITSPDNPAVVTGLVEGQALINLKVVSQDAANVSNDSEISYTNTNTNNANGSHVIVSVYESTGTYAEVTNNTVTLSSSVEPTSNQYWVVVNA
jgi:hypothetical protein